MEPAAFSNQETKVSRVKVSGRASELPVEEGVAEATAVAVAEATGVETALFWTTAEEVAAAAAEVAAAEVLAGAAAEELLEPEPEPELAPLNRAGPGIW